MIVYIVTYVLVLIFGLSGQYVNSLKPVEDKVHPNGSITRKNHYSVFYFLIIATLLFVGGFRWYVGTDFGAYLKYFFSWEEIVDKFKNLDEPGFWYISYLCRLIWDEGIFVIFVINMIIVLLTFYGFAKYDENRITLYVLLFITIGAWTFSFNGVRQAAACAIVFCGISIIERQYNKYFILILKILIVCLFAYLFHKSAILITPILLISHRKIDIKQLLILLLCAIAIPLLFDNAFEVMEVDQSNEVAKTYITHEINPIRVIVSIAPLLLLALIRDKEELFTNERFICNMTFFHSILNITTMQSAYMHRMTQYTTYFVLVFIIRCLQRIDIKIRWIVVDVTLILYTIYFFYEISISESLNNFQWAFNYFGLY